MLSGARREPDPPCHEDAEYVSMRKQSDIAVNSADPGDNSIHPRTNLLWHLGLPQVLGSGGDRYWWVWIVAYLEPLSETGTESAIIDGATNLKQQIGAAS